MPVVTYMGHAVVTILLKKWPAGQATTRSMLGVAQGHPGLSGKIDEAFAEECIARNQTDVF